MEGMFAIEGGIPLEAEDEGIAAGQ